MTQKKAIGYAERGIRVSVLVAGLNTLMAFSFPIIFIWSQGEKSLGYYLTLSAVPSLIVFVERGKVAAASVLMSKLHTEGDSIHLLGLFRRLQRETSTSAAIAAPFLVLFACAIHPQTIQTVTFLSLISFSGFLSLETSCLEAFFRGVGKYSEGIVLFTLSRVTEFIGLIVGIVLRASFVQIALLGIVGRILGLGIFKRKQLIESRQLYTGKVRPDESYLAEYKSGANANLGVTFGLIFQNQISLLIIERTLGLRLVAEYSILRTFSGFFKTLLNGVLSGTNAAFTISYHKQSKTEIKELSLLLSKLQKIISISSVPVSLIIYSVWIRFQGSWPSLFEYSLLVAYLVCSSLDGFFLKEMSLANSINIHGALGRLFMLTNVLATMLLALLLPLLGLFSYPVAFLLLDLVMIPSARIFRARLFN